MEFDAKSVCQVAAKEVLKIGGDFFFVLEGYKARTAE